MTRKDFELIAEIINSNLGDDDNLTWKIVAREFASKLARTNPNFDRSRFLRACGVED